MNSAGLFKIKSFQMTVDPIINGIMQGVKWDATNITYSFPDSKSDFVSGYPNGYEQGFSSVSSQMQSLVRAFLDAQDGNAYNNGFSVEGFTNLKIKEGTDEKSLIRFSMTSEDIGLDGSGLASSGGVSAHPVLGKGAGDIWFADNDPLNWSPVTGNRGFHAMLHELGHSLGLKHGHEVYKGWPALPADKMGLAYSVMTYQTAPGYSQQYAQEAPQTFMIADIKALQKMYGADYTVNATDTVYSWIPGDDKTLVNGGVAFDGLNHPYRTSIWAAIWDGGGNDTYDFSLYNNDSTLTLEPGEYSTFDTTAILFYDNATGKIVSAPGNIANSYRVGNKDGNLIENIIAGQGNDSITGNKLDNMFTGNGGEDTFIFKGDWGTDTITDFQDGLDKLDVDGLFSMPHAESINGDTVIFVGNEKIVLENFDIANLDYSDFV